MLHHVMLCAANRYRHRYHPGKCIACFATHDPAGVRPPSVTFHLALPSPLGCPVMPCDLRKKKCYTRKTSELKMLQDSSHDLTLVAALSLSLILTCSITLSCMYTLTDG